MKHAIGFPSVLAGRRVRWTFELSAERREIPMSPSARATIPVPQAPEGAEAAPTTPPAAPPIASASEVNPAAVVARPVTRSRMIALAAAATGVVVALALARYLASGEEYDPADAFFASDTATTDRGSTMEPVASAPATPAAPATPSAPAAAAPAALETTAPVTLAVRPIEAKQAAAETASTPSGRRMSLDSAPGKKPSDSAQGKKTVAEASAAMAVTTPAADRREPEESTKAPATDAAATATEIAPAPAASITTAVDEVTITGCLEIDTNQSLFRLADTEGASAPKARSWRSGFRKRAAPVDLAGSIDALSLQHQVGQRIAATGVLTSRTLKVSSVRVVSPSCN